MGLTIHYQLESPAADPADIRPLVGQLRQRALDLSFADVGEMVELEACACDYRNCPHDDPKRWLLIQAAAQAEDPYHVGFRYTVAPGDLIAFTAWPGQGCEPANFGLCRYPRQLEVADPVHRGKTCTIPLGLAGWRWRSFCKTQYALTPDHGGLAHFLRCHLAVIRLLDHARSLGLVAAVHDEGGYWETRSLKALAGEAGQASPGLVELAARLSNWFGEEVAA